MDKLQWSKLVFNLLLFFCLFCTHLFKYGNPLTGKKKGSLDDLTGFYSLCSASLSSLWVLMKHVPSLLYLSLISDSLVRLFSSFSKIVCGHKHHKCLTVSVRRCFPCTQTTNNNQFLKPPCLFGCIINQRNDTCRSQDNIWRVKAILLKISESNCSKQLLVC